MLTPRQRSSYLDKDGKTWHITADVLDEIEGDIQAIINCTRSDDFVIFEISSSVHPVGRVFIPWSLKLGTRGGAADIEGDGSESLKTGAARKTVFRCPRENEGLFVIK